MTKQYLEMAGADVDSFITQKGLMMPSCNNHIRIPCQGAWIKLHMGIINKIKKNRIKFGNQRHIKVHYLRYDDFEELDMSSGEWLVGVS